MKFNNDLIVFIHIPRTSGSYIETELCKKYNCILDWPKPNLENLFGLHKVNNNNYFTLQHLTLKEMLKYDFINKNIDDQFIFTVIRNPYDRILSIYRYGFSKCFNTFDKFLDAIEKLHLENYEYSGIITENENFDYKNMLSNISDIKYFFLPQYYYIADNSNCKVNIIKYEEIEKLNEILGINLKFNQKANKYNLSESQKNKIYEIYKIDFENFNFTK